MHAGSWKLALTLLASCALVLPVLAAVGTPPSPPEAAAAVEAAPQEPADGELAAVVPADPQQPLFTSTLCIEPSPCETSAECGYTKEGFPGVCLLNLDYPEVDSDKVCHCP